MKHEIFKTRLASWRLLKTNNGIAIMQNIDSNIIAEIETSGIAELRERFAKETTPVTLDGKDESFGCVYDLPDKY